MKIYLATMGGAPQGESRWTQEGIVRDFNAEAERLKKSAEKYPFDDMFILDNDYIYNSPFYEGHKEVLDKPSFGTAFKPLGFYQILRTLETDDVLLWVDSNHIIDKSPIQFINIAMQYGIFCRDHYMVYYPCKNWTYKDMFVNMNCDEEKYWEFPQLQCNVIAMKKDDAVLKFTEEFLNFSLNPKVMFGEGKHSNVEGFREHRHEQSIFSLLICKYHIPYLVRSKNPECESIIPELEAINV
jgi:hypothetical protein